MENPQKPDQKLILGLPPVALCILSPLLICGVASLANWLFMFFLNLFR
jgi:hypothetical protein